MSGYSDSNGGPLGPKPSALANCATSRLWTAKVLQIFEFAKKFDFYLLSLIKSVSLQPNQFADDVNKASSDARRRTCNKPYQRLAKGEQGREVR